MRFTVKHDIRGRLRIHAAVGRMTYEQADALVWYLESLPGIRRAKVYDRTCDAVVWYGGSRDEVIAALRSYVLPPAVRKCSSLRMDRVNPTAAGSGSQPFGGAAAKRGGPGAAAEAGCPAPVPAGNGRALSNAYQERLVGKVALHYFTRWVLPAPVRSLLAIAGAIRYIGKGLHCLWRRRIEVPVLDATAIAASLLRGEYATASSIMFLLGVGELLEEWTHKKSVDDLARTMALNTGKVWLKTEGGQVLVPSGQVRAGDEIIVHMGSVIPFDGVVTGGEAMVNQASLTGESVPAEKRPGSSVYAGTVVEEGELTFLVKAVEGASRYDKIVGMIEESEKLKSAVESRAEHLADRLVPYTLAGTALTWLLTRNVTKTMSILMVDFSCALKLAMPVAVLTAIREAGEARITVKGGKFLEAVADADTIVFDKTGTLTRALPTVVEVVSFDGREPDELLRIAACLEEHFPHSMASAVVEAAGRKGLDHEEMHTKVEYVVAHGISTTIDGRRAVIGSYHFLFEDEECVIPEGKRELFDRLPEEYSHLYMAIENELAAVICIEDPLRKEAAEVVRALREEGFSKIVMMTGDSERTAASVAAAVGVDEYYSEVLPEDKASYVEREKALGRKVIMIGDGINDSPALSAADVGIAISDGAQLAREIADITIREDDLSRLVVLRRISRALMRRITGNYRRIVGFNSGLIAGGVLGLLQPTTSALLHNTSTILIGVGSMQNYTDNSPVRYTKIDKRLIL